MEKQIIIGVDEVGRGCLAGPVFAAAVVLNFPVKNLRDSKQLNPQKREELAKIIEEHHLFAIGQADLEEIQELNIHHASLLAMKRAVQALSLTKGFLTKESAKDLLEVKESAKDLLEVKESAKDLLEVKESAKDLLEVKRSAKNSSARDKDINGHTPRSARGLTRGHLLVDGAFPIPQLEGYKQDPIVKGDQKFQAIMAASIMAKTKRDHLMREYAKQYPEYGFEKHKGYGTLEHKKAIEKYGPCPIHRNSFSGVREHLKQDLKTTKPQDLKTVKSQDLKTVKSQDQKIVKSQDQKIAKLQEKEIALL